MTSAPAEPPDLPGDAYAWPPLPILDPDEAAAVMADRLGAAYDDLEAERIHVITSLFLGRKALVDKFLGDFQTALVRFAQRVDANVGELVAKHIGPVYAEGAKAATGEPDMTWTAAHTAALTALATDTYGDFLQRSLEAGRVSEAFVKAVRAAAATEVPKLAAGGRTARQAADRLERSLVEDYGVDVITYRNGARVTPRSYARMATRTKSAVAYNAGTLNGAVELGVGYVEVFDGPECGWKSHDDEDKANRTIRSVADAGRYAISHPNCRRAFGPRPDVTSEQEAAEALPTSTVAQEEDQRGADSLQAVSSARVRAAAARRQRLAAKRAARRSGSTSTEQLAEIIRAARTYVEGSD
jgi:hypothetical protein